VEAGITAAVEADEAAVEVAMAPTQLAVAIRSASARRRRTSLTWPSTWIRRSQSSSMAAEKVSLKSMATADICQNSDVSVRWWTVTGTLKGYDALMNLVLDDVEEVMRGMLYTPHFGLPIGATNSVVSPTDDEGKEATRSLGLVVVRGTLLVVISPVDGSEEIENPFLQQGDD
jgi:small nuclear ribonucleoprotein (snRNP)-like protein